MKTVPQNAQVPSSSFKLKTAATALALILASAWLFPIDQANAQSNRAKEKKQAEATRVELQQKLKALKKDISKTESAKEKASDALEESEQAISEANRSIRDLQVEQQQANERLDQLVAEQVRLTTQVEHQKKQLSNFLRRQYMHGDSDRIKLLLSGDNPNRINRDLHYMSYVSQTQAKLITALRVSLDEIEKNKLAAQETKNELDEIAEEERSHKKSLEKEKKRHAALVGELASKLHAQKKEAASLEKDEQRLSNLVIRLNKLMEEQARAEQLRRAQLEKQRQEKLAQDKALRDKNQQAGQVKSGTKTDGKPNRESEEPKGSMVEHVPQSGMFDGQQFSQLRGQLRLPVKGELVAKFGTRRGDGPSWKGLFIKAAEGAEIKAVAAGKVVFAEWLRGFGNMIILDHGGQYLSLYSNTQAVLKHVGDVVKAGDTIANTGNSGGSEETGLYFELRYKGQVFDPMSWVRK
ncbi:murein hydrolase activator EnvC family protein [Undibacterium fentianense]|uniref:murein hydrolase activator EnvC family protein n=1 Tax=Undibacterium fentianense TaxID=2828728 RepID=UPI001E4A56A4|nr:peptidoglycan DD-metalloendopeptidase family protein [Undibacterium fentianense]